MYLVEEDEEKRLHAAAVQHLAELFVGRLQWRGHAERRPRRVAAAVQARLLDAARWEGANNNKISHG